MGIDYAYFAAADDEFAPAASSRSGGPLRWPVVVGTRRVGLLRKEPITESLGPAVEGFAARGYDPIVTMGTLEALLRDVAYESLEADSRWGSTRGGGDDHRQPGIAVISAKLVCGPPGACRSAQRPHGQLYLSRMLVIQVSAASVSRRWFSEVRRPQMTPSYPSR